MVEAERLLDLGGEPSKRQQGTPRAVADLVDLHMSDLQEVGCPLRRSKHAMMLALKCDLGATRPSQRDRAKIIRYGKQRAKQGAGPVTVSVDLFYLNTILTHAAAVHGIKMGTESV